MISFDLDVFLLQLVIFIFFLLFTSRFIVKPVNEMAAKRKIMLEQEKNNAEKIENKVEDYREIYEFDINSAHKEGSALLRKTREKAIEERTSFIKAEKELSEKFLAERRANIQEKGSVIISDLKEKESELTTLVCKKLWGEE